MIRVMPGGLCHAHGPFKDPLRNCPHWPTCVDIPANPFFVEAGQWFTTFKGNHDAAKDVVVREAKKVVLMHDPDLVHLRDAVNSLVALEEENNKYERLAGWNV
jgi:hypothetical protein